MPPVSAPTTRPAAGRLLRHLGIVLGLVAGMLGTAPVADARIVRIVITSVQSPTFDGRTFGAVGAYEKLRGRAHGELDPADPRNAVITDIQLAPRNANGNVEYSMDIYILKPIDLGRGNGKLFMEVNNRGRKLWDSFNRSRGGDDPTTAEDAGDAFLMHQGYSIAWSGWDPGASGANSLTITVPPATNPDGSAITGPSYEYIVFDNATTMQSPLTYPAATLDQSQATLTVKPRLRDPATTIPPTGWEYTSNVGTAIRLLPPGTPFQQSAIYEFSYTATNPIVAGVGFAATRDFLSFLKYATADDDGNPNPLTGYATYAYAFTVSQPARYLNDFQTLGFNQDEGGRRVIDGILNWIGGGSGVALNFRFAQPGRTERNRQNHRYPEANFPFAYPLLTDPYTRKTGGRGVRCAATNTCPKAMEVNSANEYWVKTGSLLHTDPSGRDLRDPDNVRFYLLSGVEHTVSGSPAMSEGICQQFRNPTNPNPALRALFIALDEWVTSGVRPPRSEVPDRRTAAYSIALSDGVGYVPQEELGWPNIPGVTYTGVITVRHLFDFGPLFDEGILTINPPDFSGPVYPSFVSKVDRDGNEIAGIRLPPVEAPIATTTGWALRQERFGGPDGCEASGQWIRFKNTRAERLAAGDPRRSLEERYRNHAGYVREVARAARKLERDRFLLAEDVQRYVEEAEASDILR